MCLRSQGSVYLLIACLTACIASDPQHSFGEDPPTQVIPQAEWEARIEAALNAQGEWEFEDVPLKDVCEAIQEKLAIDVALDVKALENYGIDTQTPITRSLRGRSNRSFLHLMLNELDLTYTMRLGALWITTPEYANSLLTTRVYPVGDLLGRERALGESSREWATLIQAVDSPVGSWCGSWPKFRLVDGTVVQAITSQIAPSTWDFVGGPGAIRGIQDSIVVLHTSDIHEQVAEFLTAYRAVINNDQRDDVEKQTVFFLGQQEVSAAIRLVLEQPFTAEFKDQSLKEVVEFVSETMGIPIVIDVHALEDFGIDTATPISVKFTETRLRFALVRMLSERELTYIIRDEVLFITTHEKAEESLLIGLYPVRDLVEIGNDSWIEPLGARCDFESLTNVIQSTIAPDTWGTVGGPSSIGALLPVPTIVIAQTQDAHEKISELLTTLREVKKQ